MRYVNGESMRASDGERDRVVGVLKEQTAQGRLTLEELEERTDAAYTTRTRIELQQLTEDLPGPVVFGRDEREPIAEGQHPPDRMPAWRIVLACCGVLPRR